MQLNSKQILQIMNIEQQYGRLLQPDLFVKEFKTMDEFKEWAEEGTILDLRKTIAVFENYELYEHCAVMQKLIDNLV